MKNFKYVMAPCGSFSYVQKAAEPFHRSLFLPAAGYRNGSSVSNPGSNGNYWSTVSSSQTNAYNVNFNTTNFYSANSNNRYNGFSVRLASLVSAFTL